MTGGENSSHGGDCGREGRSSYGLVVEVMVVVVVVVVV